VLQEDQEVQRVGKKNELARKKVKVQHDKPTKIKEE